MTVWVNSDLFLSKWNVYMVALDLDFFTLINAPKEAIQSGFLALHNGKTRCSARALDWRHGGRAGEQWRVRLGDADAE